MQSKINTMDALVYKGKNNICLERREIPLITNPNEIIMKIHFTGICGTDVKIYKGEFPAKDNIIMGHESVGTIAEIGNAVKEFNIGDRVLLDPTYWCGYCLSCRKGQFNFCLHKKNHEVGIDYNGGYSSFIKISSKFIYPLPDHLSWKSAVLIEPLTCVLNNFVTGAVSHNDDILILGGGPIGALCGFVANKIAHSYIVVENSQYRLDFLRNLNLNVMDGRVFNHKTVYDLLALVSALKIRPSVVIDTTANLAEVALNILADGGKFIPMGFNIRNKFNVNLSRIVNHGIKIVGAGDYNHSIQMGISFSDNIELEKLVSHEFIINDYQKAFNLLVNKPEVSAMKVLICPGQNDI